MMWILLLIPYIALGSWIHYCLFYVDGYFSWRSMVWYILIMLFYIPAILIVAILTILSYIYYGFKRGYW